MADKAALSKRDAAIYTSVSTRYLDLCVARGELRKTKMGSKTLFRVAELDRWLRQNEVATAGASKNGAEL